MKTCYVIPEFRAIADLVAPGEMTRNWTITRINVPKASRGHGLGSQLLRQITDDADRLGLRLQLEVYASDGLDHEQLVAWYGRHGFEPYQYGYLMRRPKGGRHVHM